MSKVLTDEQVRELMCRAHLRRYDLPTIAILQDAARLGAEIEREACAKVCEAQPFRSDIQIDVETARTCAVAIRARAGKDGE